MSDAETGAAPNTYELWILPALGEPTIMVCPFPGQLFPLMEALKESSIAITIVCNGAMICTRSAANGWQRPSNNWTRESHAL